jgi:hypothetical protein
MKVVTLAQLQENFDEIMDDISDNKQFYQLQAEQGNFMLIPYEEYTVLQETYRDWVSEPVMDPFPLPVEYVGDAEPQLINHGESEESNSATL